MHTPEKEQASNLEEQDTSMILEDPELAMLAFHLRQTPPPIVNSAYREALQTKLLEMVLAQRQKTGSNEMSGGETKSAIDSEHNNIGAEMNKSVDESNTVTLEDDAELTILVRHLQQTASDVPIDPNFQEGLHMKLLDIVKTPTTVVNNNESQCSDCYVQTESNLSNREILISLQNKQAHRSVQTRSNRIK